MHDDVFSDVFPEFIDDRVWTSDVIQLCTLN